jgi:hypothetical protein
LVDAGVAVELVALGAGVAAAAGTDVTLWRDAR